MAVMKKMSRPAPKMAPKPPARKANPMTVNQKKAAAAKAAAAKAAAAKKKK